MNDGAHWRRLGVPIFALMLLLIAVVGCQMPPTTQPAPPQPPASPQPTPPAQPQPPATPPAPSTRYIATDGLDANSGTFDKPYRTIQKCASSAKALEVCAIRAGTYRETVKPNAGVRFEPYQHEIVTVDGSDPVGGWTLHAGSIYKASVTLEPALSGNQVFVDQDAMQEARWPNTETDLSRPTWAAMGTGTTYATVYDPNLPNLDWTGATLQMWSGSNPFAHQTATVASGSGGQITTDFTNTGVCPSLCAVPGGRYALVGKLAALDAPTEWFYDAAAKLLYLWAPGSANPAALRVYAKARQYAFDLRGASNVTIRNIRIFASTVITDNRSSGIVLDGLNALYVSAYSTLPKPRPGDLAYSEGDFDVVASRALQSGIVIEGSGNTIQNSTVRYSAGNGILVRGSGHTVTNNLISGAGYMGSYATGISVSGTNQKITRNTVFDTGRDGITVDWHLSGLQFKNNEIAYNNVYNASLQAVDSGGIYACCRLDASGTSIHHNWVHDIPFAQVGQSKPAGVYLDNGSGSFEVYQNAIWRIEGHGVLVHGDSKPSRNNVIRNNTVLEQSDASIYLLAISDASGTRVFDNAVQSDIVAQSVAANVFTNNNSRTAPGATETNPGSAGCQFSGCESPPPPPK